MRVAPCPPPPPRAASAPSSFSFSLSSPGLKRLPEAPACGSRRTDLEDRLLALTVGLTIIALMVIGFIYRKPLILGLIEAADRITK